MVGDQIRRLVDGEAALAFNGAGGLVLEPRIGHAIPTSVSDVPTQTASTTASSASSWPSNGVPARPATLDTSIVPRTSTVRGSETKLTHTIRRSVSVILS